MAKGKSNAVEIMCESCDEELAIKNVDGLGHVCQRCIESYKHIEDTTSSVELQVGELTDEEIDRIVDEDEDEDEETAELDFDAKELRRSGFLIDENEDRYN